MCVIWYSVIWFYPKIQVAKPRLYLLLDLEVDTA